MPIQNKPNQDKGSIEIEVKLRPHSNAAEVAQTILSLGYLCSHPRTLESDQLYDRDGGLHRQRGEVLRLRSRGGNAILTFKGAAASERYKSREEIEAGIRDQAQFEVILQRIGYRPAFRYEKFRTEFRAEGEPGLITLDETPIGLFLELEGPPQWIDQTAQRLGYSVADYITASYMKMYQDFRATQPDAPPDMCF